MVALSILCIITQNFNININITNMATEKMIEEMLHTGHLTESEAQEWQKLGDKHVKVLYHAFYKLAVNK